MCAILLHIPLKTGAGFFSVCSFILLHIMYCINDRGQLPDMVDSSDQFDLYKPGALTDVTYHFFEHYRNVHVVPAITTAVHNFNCWTSQYDSYATLDFKNLVPIVKKYFSPSVLVQAKIAKLKDTYGVDPSCTIGVHYRGTDKQVETQTPEFEVFYLKMRELSEQNPDCKILLQTDTAQFVDYIRSKDLKNVVMFEDIKPSYTTKGVHNENSKEQNYKDMQILLPSLYIMSTCRHIVCGSGNCPLWMMFFRGHNHNVHQCYNNAWYPVVPEAKT